MKDCAVRPNSSPDGTKADGLPLILMFIQCERYFCKQFLRENACRTKEDKLPSLVESPAYALLDRNHLT